TTLLFRVSKALAQEKVAKALAEEKTKLAQKRLRNNRQSINDLFTFVSENTLLNTPGMQTVRQELLNKARAHYENLSHDSEGDPELAVDLADAHFRLGKIAIALGSLE